MIEKYKRINKNNNKRVLILTQAPFPYGNAMASRMRAFCKLFSEKGFDVHVIAQFSKQKNFNPNTTYHIDDCSYEFLLSEPIKSVHSFVGHAKFLPRVKSYIEQHDVSLIFSDSCQCYFNGVLSIAQKNNIPYFVEQCEKYNITSYKLKWIDIRYIRFLHLYYHRYKKSSGIIAISRFLEKHYLKQGCNVVRIPTILDVADMTYTTDNANERIQLVYTGVARGRKELLATVIRALADAPQIAAAFQFCIYGTTKEQLLHDSPESESDIVRAGDSVVFGGIVPQEDIHGILENADYQIFLRPDRESSHAGFPTKFGESMAAGTPVIANDTGDIGLYLRSGENGYLLNDISSDEVCNVLKRIIALSAEEKRQMRIKARKTAEEVFDYRQYTDIMLDLIEKAQE